MPNFGVRQWGFHWPTQCSGKAELFRVNSGARHPSGYFGLRGNKASLLALHFSDFRSCFSRAILHFGFWRWVRAASVWAACESGQTIALSFHTHCCFVSSCVVLWPSTEQLLCPLKAWAPFWVLGVFCLEAVLPPSFWNVCCSYGYGIEWVFRKEEDIDLQVF